MVSNKEERGLGGRWEGEKGEGGGREGEGGRERDGGGRWMKEGGKGKEREGGGRTTCESYYRTRCGDVCDLCPPKTISD